MEKVLVVVVLIIAVVIGFKNFLFNRSSFISSKEDFSKSPNEISAFIRSNLFFIVLTAIFALPLFFPIKRFLPSSEAIELICLPVTAGLLVFLELRWLKLMRKMGMADFSKRYTRPTIVFAIFVGAISLFLLTVYFVNMFLR